MHLPTIGKMRPPKHMVVGREPCGHPVPGFNQMLMPAANNLPSLLAWQQDDSEVIVSVVVRRSTQVAAAAARAKADHAPTARC